MTSAPIEPAAADTWLLDFDNTLAALEVVVDWAQSRIVLEQRLRSRGCPSDLFVQVPKRNLLLYDALMRRLEEGSIAQPVGESLLETASRSIEEFELAGVDRAQALAGATELLHELAQRRLPVAIVSSNSARTIERWLASHDLSAAVTTIVGRDSYLALKPAPDMILRALAELNRSGNPGRPVMVGDSEADLVAAETCGVSFFAIAADSRSAARMRERGAGRTYRSPAELLRELKRGAGTPQQD